MINCNSGHKCWGKMGLYAISAMMRHPFFVVMLDLIQHPETRLVETTKYRDSLLPSIWTLAFARVTNRLQRLIEIDIMQKQQNQLEKTRLFLAKQPQGAQHVCTLRQANIGKSTDHTGDL